MGYFLVQLAHESNASRLSNCVRANFYGLGGSVGCQQMPQIAHIKCICTYKYICVSPILYNGQLRCNYMTLHLGHLTVGLAASNRNRNLGKNQTLCLNVKQITVNVAAEIEGTAKQSFNCNEVSLVNFMMPPAKVSSGAHTKSQ